MRRNLPSASPELARRCPSGAALALWPRQPFEFRRPLGSLFLFVWPLVGPVLPVVFLVASPSCQIQVPPAAVRQAGGRRSRRPATLDTILAESRRPNSSSSLASPAGQVGSRAAASRQFVSNLLAHYLNKPKRQVIDRAPLSAYPSVGLVPGRAAKTRAKRVWPRARAS